MRIAFPNCLRTQICLVLIMVVPAAAFALQPEVPAALEAWPADGVVVSNVDVRVRDRYPHDFDWKGLTRVLIGFQAGDRITRQQLDEARDRIAPFGREQITVDHTAAGLDLHFAIAPYRQIKTISICNNYPLFEREVRNVMTVAPGDYFHEQTVEAQKALIAERYRAEGYIDPRVKLETQQDPDDGNYRLDVVIEKGPYYKIGRIRVFGNKALPDPLLLPQLKIWRQSAFFLGTGRFREEDLKQDIKSLTAFYRSDGFADVQITAKVERDQGQARVNIILNITEGPRYILSFQGNHAFPASALQSEAVFKEIGNQGNIGVRRTVQNIRRRYLNSGYADVKVHWEETEPNGEKNGRRHILVKIDEGGRYHVVKVNIQGHDAYDSGTIYDQMLTRPAEGFGNGNYVASVLQEDLTAIGALYLQKGFLDPKIRDDVAIDPKTKAVRIDLKITEGVQTLVKSVVISGTTPLPAKELTSDLQLKKSEPYRPFLIESDRNAISFKIAHLGYPYVQVTSKVTISGDRKGAAIVYHVDSGPLVKVGRIFFSGNFRTRTSVLEREFSFHRGAPFSLSRVLEGQRNLRKLDLFDSVQVRTIGLKEKAKTVPLLVETTEKAFDYFELGGGYQTNKGAYLRSKIGDRNVLGLNKEIHTSGEISEVGYRWDAGIGDPRFLGSDISADFSIYLQREELFNQDFGTDSRGGRISFSRRWTPRITSDLSWRYEQRVQYLRADADDTETDPATLEDRRIIMLTPSIGYDSRDSFIRPRSGMLAGLSMDISRGLGNTLDNFTRYRLDLRKYQALLPRLTMAGRFRLGYMYEYGVDGQIPEDQLFFLGGATDVRGYGENLLRYDDQGDPVGGRLAINASLEARIDLSHNLEVSLFVDSGAVKDAPAGAGGDDAFHYAAGLGLSYLTPIGPLSLLYGHKLDRREGESSGEVYFSIGYTF